MAILTEERHQFYLDMFLSEVTESPDNGRILLPFIRDNLDIARSAGYVTLADTYQTLFQQRGLDL